MREQNADCCWSWMEGTWYPRFIILFYFHVYLKSPCLCPTLQSGMVFHVASDWSLFYKGHYGGPMGWETVGRVEGK